jgi:hypothetical protein
LKLRSDENPGISRKQGKCRSKTHQHRARGIKDVCSLRVHNSFADAEGGGGGFLWI